MSQKINDIDEQIKELQRKKRALIRKELPEAYIDISGARHWDCVSIKLCEMHDGKHRTTNGGNKKYHTLISFKTNDDNDIILSKTKEEIERIKNLLDAAYERLKNEIE